MKKITKNKNGCGQLNKWLRDQKGINCTYNDINQDVKEAVLNQLIREQGAICCYTGIRINADGAHIEHVYPQTLCKHDKPISRLFGAKRDVQYANLVAAYPKDIKAFAVRTSPFGAIKRGSWYDEAKFITPLQARCESAFQYMESGNIVPMNGPHKDAAEETIKQLKLDHSYLNQLRQAAIDGWFFEDDKPLSISELKQSLSNINNVHKDKQYTPFCFVLNQVGIGLYEYLIRAKRRSHIKKTEINRSRQRSMKK